MSTLRNYLFTLFAIFVKIEIKANGFSFYHGKDDDYEIYQFFYFCCSGDVLIRPLFSGGSCRKPTFHTNVIKTSAVCFRFRLQSLRYLLAPRLS